MSDDILLSLPWAVPPAGSPAVLFIPKRLGPSIKWVALVVSLLGLGLDLLAFGRYVTPGPGGVAPMAVSLQDRAERNILGPGPAGPETRSIRQIIRDTSGDSAVKDG